MQKAIQTMFQEISSAVDGHIHSIWLYGSFVLDDFRFGWSDIDFIAFTNHALTAEQVDKLLMLRQTLAKAAPDLPFYPLFEGVIMPIQAYQQGMDSSIVYWGTSGQKIIRHFSLDVFARLELRKLGKLVQGQGSRSMFVRPERNEIIKAVQNHLHTIRTFAVHTDERLYSCGWMLDIARCVYTLRFNDVVGKTQAGEWALDKHLFENEEPMKRALLIRRDPIRYRDDPDTRAWLRSLGPIIQQYADVLEKELGSASCF